MEITDAVLETLAAIGGGHWWRNIQRHEFKFKVNMPIIAKCENVIIKVTM